MVSSCVPKWWRKLAFCSLGTFLALLMMGMVFLAIVPYDIDVVVDAYLDDDLDPKLLAAGSQLKEAHERHARDAAERVRAPAPAPSPPVYDFKAKDEMDELMNQILNPEVIDPDRLIPCSADVDTLTNNNGAQAWIDKKQSKVKEQWQQFQDVYMETLARTRYCVAQSGENRCGQYRWGSDDDW